MSEQVIVEVFVKTDVVNSECTEVVKFDRADWESMTDQERDCACVEAVWNMAEWGWRIKGDE